MRHAHRQDCSDRCNGDWCECPCHQERTYHYGGEPLDWAKEEAAWQAEADRDNQEE